MKILALDQGEHLGGAERFLSELLTRLAPEDEIHLICSDSPKYHQLYQGSQVHLHKMPMPKLKPIALSSFQKFRAAQKKVQTYIQEIKPDLILSNTVRTHLISSPVAKKQQIPLVWMGHDMTFPKWILKHFLKYPQQIICCSQYVADYFDSPKTSVIYPFAVDQEKIQHLKSVQKQAIVGMVGKFIPWKGQFEFLKAAKAIHTQFPDYRFTLIADEYLGVKESHDYAKKCRDFILENHLEGVITIKSGIPDLLEEMASWQVLVHCSQTSEPLGRVILEGMASGCAVIVGNSGGPKEIVKDGVTGLLCSPDSQNITQALNQLLSDPDICNRLQKSAREATQNYLWSKQVDLLRSRLDSARKVERTS